MKTRKNFRFHYFFLIILFASLLISVGSATWVLFGHNDIGSPVYDSGNLLAEYFDESYSVVYNGETQSTIPSFKEGNPGDKQLTDFNYKFTKYHTKTTATPKDANKYTVAITPKDNSNTQPLYVTLTIEKRKVKLNKDTVEIDYTGTHPTISTILNNYFVDAETYSDGKNGVCVPEYTTDYSISNLTNGVEQHKTNTIDVGSTYTGTINQNANSNFEIQGTNFVLKYKTVQWDSDNKYYTIEDALNIATSGTLTVKANTSFAGVSVAKKEYDATGETATYTINPNTELLLPYDGTNGHAYDSNLTASSFNNNLKLELIIAPNITLNNNNGTITIGGVTTGAQGGYSGGTAGDYAQITMDSNSKIISTGNIISWGFIVEKNANNGSQVEIKSGMIKLPFIVYEHRGGTQFVDMVGGAGKADNPELYTSPFNVFYMENVRVKLIVDSGANVEGHANLHTSTPNQDNTTDINIVGTSDKSLINLSPGTKMVVKCVNGISDLEIIGSAVVNHLSITLSVLSKTVTLTTEQVHFPISYRYNVTLSPYENRPSVVTATAQKLKLLPSSTLTVSKNVTFEVDELVVYDKSSLSDLDDPGIIPYPKKDTDAYLIVNGTITGNSIAGKVQTSEKESGAVLRTTKGNSITTQELKVKNTLSSVDTLLGKGHTSQYKEITQVLIGPIYDSGVVSNLSVGMYVSKDGMWDTADQTFNVSYKYMLKSDNGVNKLIGQDINNTNVTQYNLQETYPLNNLELSGYTFLGWYSDEKCETKIDQLVGAQFYGDITLYGLFELKKVDSLYIQYKITKEGYDSSKYSPLTLSIDSIDAYNPFEDKWLTQDDYNIYVEQYFGGWTIVVSGQEIGTYSDVESLRTALKSEQVPGGSEVTLRTKYSQKIKLTFTVTATGEKKIGGGSDKHASAEIIIDKSKETEQRKSLSATGKGAGLLESVGKETFSEEMWLRPGQTYDVTITEGKISSGSQSGTAESTDINITVSNT